MSEYGSGLTFWQCCTYDKERIRHALRGDLMCGEDDDGFLYERAPKEECEQYILEAYDNCVHQATQAMDAGRAMERLMVSILVLLEAFAEAHGFCSCNPCFNGLQSLF